MPQQLIAYTMHATAYLALQQLYVQYRIIHRVCWHPYLKPTTLQVRYESRRRLAETRPRVRGQFVKAGTAASQSIAAQVCFIQPPQRYMTDTFVSTRITSSLKLAAMP